MHQEHYKALQALSDGVTYAVGSFDKRFARDLSGLGPYDMLTPKQEAHIERMAVRYRRQLSRLGYQAPHAWHVQYQAKLRNEVVPTPDAVKYHWTGQPNHD